MPRAPESTSAAVGSVASVAPPSSASPGPPRGADARAPEAARAGVYVHFPWCLAKCPYCDFVSYVAPAIDHAGYADAVLREIDARAAGFEGRRVESVFFGGGTPSLWEPRELGRVLEGIRRRFGWAPEVEVTVECNPTSLDEERARRLLEVGVNRLSIGVQSLRDDRLKFLGRLHDATGARSAVEGALASGMPRVSADLIFGLPGQTAGEARDEALELAALGVAHLSCYQLTIESGTRFGELARRGRLPLAEDGDVADAFLAIDEALAGMGFRHYEISNYARPGEEARHNLGYWRGDEYLGLGCGAYGFTREFQAPAAPSNAQPPARGTRWRNAVQPERYVANSADIAGASGSDSAEAGATLEALDAETLLRERIMLGLRVDAGIDLDAMGRELGIDAWTPERMRAATWLEGRGRLERIGSSVRVPRAAWLWTDDTAARLF